MNIFKSLEIGTLSTETIMESLTNDGISLVVNRDYFQNAQLPPFPNDDAITHHNYNMLFPTAHSNDSNLHNNQEPIDFGKFMLRPTESWKESIARSKAEPNLKLFNAYINLLNVTKQSGNIKLLPKEIKTFANAVKHLKITFIPLVVSTPTLFFLLL